MNNDITFCVNEKCDKRSECKRALYPNNGVHSYSNFSEICLYPDYMMIIKVDGGMHGNY